MSNVLKVIGDIEGTVVKEGQEQSFHTANFSVTKIFSNTVDDIENEIWKILQGGYGFGDRNSVKVFLNENELT